MSERIILAGDMALRFGVALGVVDGERQQLIASTAFDSSKIRTKHGIGAAATWIAKTVYEWADQYVHQVDRVALEEPAMHGRNVNALAQYACITGLLQAADRLDCTGDTISYWPSNVKKRATGDGKALKSVMRQFAGAFACRVIDDDDEADALLILKLAMEDQVIENRELAKQVMSQP